MSVYKACGIYAIKNTITGKAYIGKTTNNFGDRWDHHKAMLRGGKHSNHELQVDWNNVGESSFEFLILHDCTSNPSIDTINKLEIMEIANYKAIGKAYNVHDGGDSSLFLGKRLSEETKRKIGDKNRINMTGRKLSEETRKKMYLSQQARYGLWTDEDRIAHGKLMSEKNRGYKWNDEQRAKMKNNKNGAKYTIDQVREIRRLHEKDHKDYSEISAITGIPRPAVYLIATYRRWKDV